MHDPEVQRYESRAVGIYGALYRVEVSEFVGIVLTGAVRP